MYVEDVVLTLDFALTIGLVVVAISAIVIAIQVSALRRSVTVPFLEPVSVWWLGYYTERGRRSLSEGKAYAIHYDGSKTWYVVRVGNEVLKIGTDVFWSEERALEASGAA